MSKLLKRKPWIPILAVLLCVTATAWGQETINQTWGGEPQYIPDNGTLLAVLNVPRTIAIEDLNVTVHIEHQLTGDLIITLTSPGLTQVQLVDRECETANFRNTVFDDQAADRIAYPLSGRVGLGATGYVAVRSQRRRRQVTASVVDTTGAGTSTINFDDLSYWNLRVLAKIGLQFDFAPLQLGVTVTTPGLSLFGDGETRINRSVINPDTVTSGFDESELVADIQKGIPSTYKSPLSIAIGAEYDLGQTSVFFSGEWFNGVDRYAILDAEPFVGQTTGDTVSIDIVQELDPVVNLGIGVEHAVSNTVEIYGAAFTDRSAFDRESIDPLPIATWDILHFTAGAAFQVGSIDLTLGASYGRGNGEALPADFLGQPTDVTGTYRSLKFILGFQLAL